MIFYINKLKKKLKDLFFMSKKSDIYIMDYSELYLMNYSELYFLILRQNLSNFFLTLKSLKFFLYVYWSTTTLYSIYKVLEFFSVQLNLFHLVFLRLFITNFFISKLCSVFCLFYYFYLLIVWKAKAFLIENQFF